MTPQKIIDSRRNVWLKLYQVVDGTRQYELYSRPVSLEFRKDCVDEFDTVIDTCDSMILPLPNIIFSGRQRTRGEISRGFPRK